MHATQIRATDDQVVAVLPRGFRPIAWSPDGTRLLGGLACGANPGLALVVIDPTRDAGG